MMHSGNDFRITMDAFLSIKSNWMDRVRITTLFMFIFSSLIFCGKTKEKPESFTNPNLSSAEFIPWIDLARSETEKNAEVKWAKNEHYVNGYHLHKQSRNFRLPSSVSTFKKQKKTWPNFTLKKKQVRAENFTIFYLLSELCRWKKTRSWFFVCLHSTWKSNNQQPHYERKKVFANLFCNVTSLCTKG